MSFRIVRLALSLLAAVPAAAADADASLTNPQAPSVAAVAVGDASPPVIDGDISDAVWMRANRIERFWQIEPKAGAEPGELTEAWVLYDRNALYVAMHMHQRDPTRIVATTMERDAVLRNNDAIRILLDPRRSRREGYFFEINPAGARTDALLSTEGSQPSIVSKWNMLWQARSRRVADGWTMEAAIPFRGLAYDKGNSSWGFDLARQVKQSNEQIRWALTPAGARMMDISYAGTLTGLTGLTQGNGLDVIAYGLGRATRNWRNDDTTVSGKPSATAYYKFTPALTGLLTFNTDFSDTPLDNRQVNTSRFSLFEPETREFFLEDADAFEFGVFGQGPAANARPFFSRNIGLVNGRIVDLNAGAKLSGNIGGARIGALSVRTAGDAQLASQTLSVARVSTDVLSESRIGGIFTDGDPTGATRNQVAGVDFMYRNSNLRPGKRLNATAYYERSSSSRFGDDATFGTEVSYPNEPWGMVARYKQVGQDFRTPLGFTNRPGIRTGYLQLDRTNRYSGRALQRVQLQAAALLVANLDNRVESRNDWISVDMETPRADRLMLAVDNYIEVLDSPFVLPGNVTVPAGNHEFVRWTAELQTAPSRVVSAKWTLICCAYYNGTSTESDLQFEYHPNARFSTLFQHRLQPIHLPGGRTTIHIESLNATVNFTPEMKLTTEVQYDNVSNRLGGSLRYRWEIRPTTELLVTLAESALMEGRPLHGRYYSQASAIAVRLGHRFQY